jgi:hypothetical protein
MKIRYRIDLLLRRTSLDSEIHEELETHIAMRTKLNETSGLAAPDAEREARKSFGNATRIQEDIRRVHVGALGEALFQDARYALRSFVRAPGFAFVVIAALAIGIGATTAVFSVVDRILFRSLPYANEDRLVSIGVTAPLDSNEFIFAADYRDWERANTPFESWGSFVIGGPAGGAGCDLTEVNPVRVSCALVDPSFLPTLGVAPLMGRNFTNEDDSPGAPRVALITYGLWQNRFGTDPATVGRTISIDSKPVQVIGVLPRDFEMPTLTHDDILLPVVGEFRKRPEFLSFFSLIPSGACVLVANC